MIREQVLVQAHQKSQLKTLCPSTKEAFKNTCKKVHNYQG